MKKKLLGVTMLLLLVMLFTSCTNNDPNYTVAIDQQDVRGEQTEMPTQPSVPQEDEDLEQMALNEEGSDPGAFSEGEFEQQEDMYMDPADQVAINPLTGATPIVLNPINMPSATPAGDITFTYQEYNASDLGLTFQGPAGWMADDASQEGAYILTDPNEYNGVQATITFTRQTLQEEQKSSDLKNRLNAEMDAMGKRDFTEFKPSSLAERTFLGEEGVYVNYRGVLPGGAVVRGRYQIVSVKKVLYTVHLRHAADYNTSFINNFHEIRDTIKVSD
ncbi:MAG: hypothetical protein GX786_01960 [Clostridiales bacterium]|nr:hypothetical protein [Clostridiales bacterium]